LHQAAIQLLKYFTGLNYSQIFGVKFIAGILAKHWHGAVKDKNGLTGAINFILFLQIYIIDLRMKGPPMQYRQRFNRKKFKSAIGNILLIAPLNESNDLSNATNP
jgi:hypothetical protein